MKHHINCHNNQHVNSTLGVCRQCYEDLKQENLEMYHAFWELALLPPTAHINTGDYKDFAKSIKTVLEECRKQRLKDPKHRKRN